MPLVVKAKPKHTLAGDAPLVVTAESYDDSDLAADVMSLYNSPVEALIEKVAEAAAKLKAKKAEYDEKALRVAKYIETKQKMAPGDKTSLVVMGKNVDIGALTASREITDLSAVREKLGDDVFMQLASVKLGDLDKYMTEPERKKVTKVTYTGKRKVTVS